jgi:YVTN family beta-propeller protein
MVVCIAYPARAQYGPGFGGKLLGPGCCPIVRSYSTIGSISASAEVNVGSREEVSTSLVFSSLNTTGIYWVKLSAVSLNGTTALSPISYVLLETAGAAEAVNGGGTGACGGQKDVGPIFADSDNREVYVANSGTDAISVLNGSTGRLIATISLPDLGQLSFFNYSSEGELYVAGQDSSKIHAIDTSTNYLVGEAVGDSTSDIARVDGKIFLVGQSANTPISVFDTSTDAIVASITGVQSPVWSIYSSGNSELYIETYNQTVFALDLSDCRVVAKIPIPYEYNSNFLYDSANGMLYTVTNGVPQNSANSSPATTDCLLMINTTSNTLVDTNITFPSLGFIPVLYTPSNGEIYPYDGSNTLVAVNTTKDTIVASIPVRGVDVPLVIESPYIFYDSATGNVYATTDLNPANGTTGLLEISGKTNAVISHVTLAGLGFGNDLAFDSNNRVLFGAGD